MVQMLVTRLHASIVREQEKHMLQVTQCCQLPVQNIHVGAVDKHQMAHHSNVAIAGCQMQSSAVMIVPVVHLHIIAA